MMPRDIEEFMSKEQEETSRGEPSLAREVLKNIGVSEASQFGEFFVRYRVNNLRPAVTGEELLDLVSPTPQISRATVFAHDVFAVPKQFIALTSGETEGFYLYDPATEAVYDVGVEEVSELKRGLLRPRWSDFFSFVRWYLQNPFAAPSERPMS